MQSSKKCLVVFLVLAGAVLCASAAWAEGEEQAAAQASTGTAAGMVGQVVTWAIYGLQALISLILVALVVFYFLNIKASSLIPAPVVEQMTEMLNRGAYDELNDFCKTAPTHLTNVVATGLDKARKDGYQAAMTAIDDKIAEEGLLLENRISWLNFISVISPMLGLFGTVVGMVMSFDAIATVQNPQPADLAAGIRAALWTTVFGLMIAMPAMSFFFYFRNRLARVVMEMGMACEGMFEHFRRGPSEKGA